MAAEHAHLSVFFSFNGGWLTHLKVHTGTYCTLLHDTDLTADVK